MSFARRKPAKTFSATVALTILGAFLSATAVQAGEKRDAAVLEAWSRSKTQQACCEELGAADFTSNIVTSRIQSIPLEIGHTRLFDGKKAAFVGLALPIMHSPYFLQVGSGIKSVTRLGGMGSVYFFDPVVIFLGVDFRELRRIDSFACKFAESGIAAKGEGGYFGAIKVDPALEKYVVVLANPETEGKSVDFKLKGLYPYAFSGMSADWQVPFGPDGIVEFRMAADSLVKRLRARGCKVTD